MSPIWPLNDDSPKIFDNNFEYYENSGVTNCIKTGDFNVTLNPD